MPTRRQFVKGLGIAALACGTRPAFATYQLTPYIGGARREATIKSLNFYQTHTGERLSATFYEGGLYDRDALAQIDHLLRDHRTGEVKAMDTDLLDLLYDIKAAFDTDMAFQVISGYRSPKTNAMLAARSKGVDKNSFHMAGRAIDIRIPGVRTGAIRDLAKEMGRGGVGFYASSDFVHLDTGPVRYW